MARHISIIIMLAVAGFVILSFSKAFDRTDKLSQILPVKNVQEPLVTDSSGTTTESKEGGATFNVPEPEVKETTTTTTTTGSKGTGSAYKVPESGVKETTTTGQKFAFESIPDDILTGGSIAPKLENATAKAELGRASWKLFHTMMARFPETPTEEDSLALKTYIQLFARLYPCGDCASHFQKLITKYPPQTGSRNSAAGWACYMHNLVNERLQKPTFDCNNIGDFYDCGCGDEDRDKNKKTSYQTDEDGELKLERHR
ncbi:ERV/ALR sulfhydryl oxidase domain-containing protein [Xylariaceae sp. FL0804]|nr:ERV/ALR sulfhydryl oxidase domain-containing protein [Xylariaceae sp. FL0804]